MNFRIPADHFWCRLKKPLGHYTSPKVDYSRYEAPTWVRRGNPDPMREREQPAMPMLLRRQAG